MKALIRDLTKNLEAQTEGYRRVLAMAEDERRALVDRRPQQVLDLVRAKEGEVVALRGLEQARRLLTMRAARRLEIKRPDLGVRELLARTAGDTELDAEREALARVAAELRGVLESIRQVNEAIATLCESGLGTVEYLARGIARERSAPESLPYGRGARHQAPATGGAIRLRG